MTQFEVLAPVQELAKRYASCLSSIGPHQDLTGLVQAEPLEQKHALCSFWIFPDAAYRTESDLSRLGEGVTADLAEMGTFLRGASAWVDCRWRAAEPQFAVVNHVMGAQQGAAKWTLWSPDAVRCTTTVDGLRLEVLETASVHLLVVPRESFDVLSVPEAQRAESALRVLQKLTTLTEQTLRSALTEPFVEGLYDADDRTTAEVWTRAAISLQPLLVIRDGALHLVLAKLLPTPPTIPVAFRGIDPTRYLPPALKATHP